MQHVVDIIYARMKDSSVYRLFYTEDIFDGDRSCEMLLLVQPLWHGFKQQHLRNPILNGERRHKINKKTNKSLPVCSINYLSSVNS